MKTMSQFSKLSECPETLEEARKVIDDLEAKHYAGFEYGKKAGRAELLSAIKKLLEIPTITE